MRSSFVSRTGIALAKTPNYRQQAARRRMMAICAILGLALASGLFGVLTAPSTAAQGGATSATGPFSYFPHQ